MVNLCVIYLMTTKGYTNVVFGTSKLSTQRQESNHSFQQDVGQVKQINTEIQRLASSGNVTQTVVNRDDDAQQEVLIENATM